MARILEGGRNSISASEEASYVEAIEEIRKELLTEKSVYMSKCKAIRQKEKEVLEDAKGQGGNPKSIKGAVKRREMERKLAAHDASFEDDDAARYEAILKALSGMEDTPLGQAALKTASDDSRTSAVVGAVKSDLSTKEQTEWEKAAPQSVN